MSVNENSGHCYVRRRCYSKVHVKSWTIFLEKDGYVKCSFQNCKFMAFDVDEMAKHYSLCAGKNSPDAKYICPKCDGWTSTNKKLQTHMLKIHDIELVSNDERTLNNSIDCIDAKNMDHEKLPLSKVLILSWNCSFEKNRYIKCSYCSLLAKNVDDLIRHYPDCKLTSVQACYVCQYCLGRAVDIGSLIYHTAFAHNVVANYADFNEITFQMVRFWEDQFKHKKFSYCLHKTKGENDCLFFAMDIINLILHAQNCKGQKPEIIHECFYCGCWTTTAEKLQSHLQACHKDPLSRLIFSSASPTKEISNHSDDRFVLGTDSVYLKEKDSSKIKSSGYNLFDEVEDVEVYEKEINEIKLSSEHDRHMFLSDEQDFDKIVSKHEPSSSLSSDIHNIKDFTTSYDSIESTKDVNSELPLSEKTDSLSHNSQLQIEDNNSVHQIISKTPTKKESNELQKMHLSEEKSDSDELHPSKDSGLVEITVYDKYASISLDAINCKPINENSIIKTQNKDLQPPGYVFEPDSHNKQHIEGNIDGLVHENKEYGVNESSLNDDISELSESGTNEQKNMFVKEDLEALNIKMEVDVVEENKICQNELSCEVIKYPYVDFNNMKNNYDLLGTNLFEEIGHVHDDNVSQKEFEDANKQKSDEVNKKQYDLHSLLKISTNSYKEMKNIEPKQGVLYVDLENNGENTEHSNLYEFEEINTNKVKNDQDETVNKKEIRPLKTGEIMNKDNIVNIDLRPTEIDVEHKIYKLKENPRAKKESSKKRSDFLTNLEEHKETSDFVGIKRGEMKSIENDCIKVTTFEHHKNKSVLESETKQINVDDNVICEASVDADFCAITFEKNTNPSKISEENHIGLNLIKDNISSIGYKIYVKDDYKETLLGEKVGNTFGSVKTSISEQNILILNETSEKQEKESSTFVVSTETPDNFLTFRKKREDLLNSSKVINNLFTASNGNDSKNCAETSSLYTSISRERENNIHKLDMHLKRNRLMKKVSNINESSNEFMKQNSMLDDKRNTERVTCPSTIKRKRGRPPKIAVNTIKNSKENDLNNSTGTALSNNSDTKNTPKLDKRFKCNKLLKRDLTMEKGSEKLARQKEGNNTKNTDSNLIVKRKGRCLLKNIDEIIYSPFKKNLKNNLNTSGPSSFDNNDMRAVENNTQNSDMVSKYSRLLKKVSSKYETSDELLEQNSIIDANSTETDSSLIIKKKRGRPKKTEEIVSSPQNELNNSSTNKTVPRKGMVKCGRCGEEMVKSVYKLSHLSKHNYLCWIEGEKPIDLNDEDAVRKFLSNVSQKLKKKIIFKCEKCGESKRSALGYVSHVRFCGKTDEEREALLTKCKICGRGVMPVSITTHMEMHNRKRKVPKSEKNHLSIEKRAAARKAVKGIGKASNYSDNEKEVSTKKIRMEVDIEVRQMYSRKCNKVYVSQIEVWKKSISENGNAKCLYPGCNFIGQTVEVLENHGMECPRKPQKVYSCRKCKFQSFEEQLVIEHIEEIHNNGEDSYSSESDVDDEAGFQDIKFIQSYSRLRYHNFFSPALKWTYDKRLKNSGTCNESLCYEVSNWTPIDSDKTKCYLPTTKKSVKIMVNEQNWEQLELFQSLELNGTQAIFVGGPVWASAWAPVPLTETHQYLAVACHPNMDTEHEMGRIYDYKSMIQIWDYGELCNIGDNHGVAPFLLLGIAHNHGAVWSLDWCVSGFISTQLGLLAAAFSDGTVAIYSIPRHRPSDGYTMYKVKPVCVLKLGSEILSQCMRVEWHKIVSSRVIAAGFSNGMVAVWDLNTSSSLLRSDDTLYPYCIFQAHNSSVTGIGFGPGEEVRYMCTSSHDRTIKFWDLQNTDYPISVNQKGSATDTAWMSNWLCSVSTHDSIYGYGITYVNATNGRDFVYHSNSLLQQNSVNWSVGICDWLNSIGMSDEAGNVNIMFLYHLGCIDDKKARKHSFNLIKTSIHDFKEDNFLVTGNVQQNKSNNARTKKNKPQRITLFEKSLDSDLTKYKEMASRFGLSLSVDKKLKSTHNDGSNENLINHYPLSSINKVSWNPNYSSFLWIAAGFQCGIILTPRIGYIKEEVLKTFYKEKEAR